MILHLRLEKVETDPSKHFVSARLKMSRAYRHITEVDFEWRQFLKTDFYQLRTDIDPRTGRFGLRVDDVKTVPAMLPTVIGDAIHNLRAALDHITSQIVGVDDDRVHFPMNIDPERLVASGQFKRIEKANPEIARVIADEIRPDKLRNPPLWSLGRLDNVDKHKLLIPAVAITEIVGICAVDELNNQIVDAQVQVEEGRVVGLFAQIRRCASRIPAARPLTCYSPAEVISKAVP